MKEQSANLFLLKMMCLPVFPTKSLGGARRDRTDDPLLAKQVLSQLSYGPLDFYASHQMSPFGEAQFLVGLGGLEPPTSRLSSARSNQLSYKPSAVSAAGKPHQHRTLQSVRSPEGLGYII